MKDSKKILSALLMIMSLSLAWADISVYFKNERNTATLPEIRIGQASYVDFDELNQVFNSTVKQDRSDNRLHLFLNGKQFIFLIGSPFYSIGNDSWNLFLNVARVDSKFYVPSNFITEHLPLHFADMELKGQTLQVNRPKDRSVKVIVLDPGHGGQDPGAVGHKLKLREKDVNLGVCLKLKKLLEQELGVTVLMTRSTDVFITLGNRTRFANNNHADIFVSVHTNASKNKSASGMETYYLSTALTSDARAVEALENNVVELYEGGKQEKAKYDALSFILSDMSQTEHLENSNSMALLVQQNLVAGAKGNDRGVKQANFYVLRGAFMPAVLIELGFITNEKEEQLLANDEYQARLARTIFEGLKRFKFRYDRIRNS